MFVGWTAAGDMDFYVRQFRDMKVIPDGATIDRTWRSSPVPAAEYWLALTREVET